MHSFATVPLSYLQGLVNFYVIALGSMLSIAVCENVFFFFFLARWSGTIGKIVSIATWLSIPAKQMGLTIGDN